MKLELKKNMLCYPLFECGKDEICKKISNTKNSDIKLYELRIDYMLNKGQDIDDIICDINYIKRKFSKLKFISTIRTKSEGGLIGLSGDKYYAYVEKLFKFSKTDFVDIEFKYYKKYKKEFEKILNKTNKKIIISKHIFDDDFSENSIKRYIEESIFYKGDCVKLAILVINKNSFYELVSIIKKYENLLKKAKKEPLFIAMGKDGVLSRILPEIFNTKIVFLNAYNKVNKLGQISYTSYIKYRKLLAKKLIN